MSLKLDWCSHAAAKWAVENWHYSKTMPVSKNARLGVWEDGAFIGAVVFATGANMSLGAPYGLTSLEVCELVRVALKAHKAPVSRIVAIALRMLKKHCPGTRLVVSFADPMEGHTGGIYQAGGWLYTGRSSDSYEFRLNGKRLQKRAYTGFNFSDLKRQKLPPGAVKVPTVGKHRYLMPLDAEMRARLAGRAMPYPKRNALVAVGGPASKPADVQPDPGAPK
ncbi:MAG TPA: protein Mom [Polyangiaceae bacterium]|nr:protein Mom [Polyangiaceae bacterium]